ncbi:uncharacterized protein JCM15063_001500 [Sporobolomyces koalae]|uniref:uncharacterized protein n=1 Tax=Sporobolomyces koalae TaxID=500713 RepID=UPI00317C32DA
MTSTSTIGPYSTSNAVSTTHYKLVQSLEVERDSTDLQLSLNACLSNVRRSWAHSLPKPAQAYKDLVLVLYCHAQRETQDLTAEERELWDGEWALVGCQRLAGSVGVGSLQHRALGYRACAELFPPSSASSHPLKLLLINTLRSDLYAEGHAARWRLALRALTHENLVTSELVAAVKERVIELLQYDEGPTTGLRKLALEALVCMIKASTEQPDLITRARQAIVDLLAAELLPDPALSTLSAQSSYSPSADSSTTGTWRPSRSSSKNLQYGLILPLVFALSLLSPTFSTGTLAPLLAHLNKTLLASSASNRSDPSTKVFVLRALALLPTESWAGSAEAGPEGKGKGRGTTQYGEAQWGQESWVVILDGLKSSDENLRRATLHLLSIVDSNILNLHSAQTLATLETTQLPSTRSHLINMLIELLPYRSGTAPNGRARRLPEASAVIDLIKSLSKDAGATVVVPEIVLTTINTFRYLSTTKDQLDFAQKIWETEGRWSWKSDVTIGLIMAGTLHRTLEEDQPETGLGRARDLFAWLKDEHIEPSLQAMLLEPFILGALRIVSLSLSGDLDIEAQETLSEIEHSVANTMDSHQSTTGTHRLLQLSREVLARTANDPSTLQEIGRGTIDQSLADFGEAVTRAFRDPGREELGYIDRSDLETSTRATTPTDARQDRIEEISRSIAALKREQSELRRERQDRGGSWNDKVESLMSSPKRPVSLERQLLQDGSATAAQAAAAAANTSFRPGVAASGTATRTVPNGPPTHSGYLSIGDGFYSSWSFANQGTELSLAPNGAVSTAGTRSTASAGRISGAAGASNATDGIQLSQNALIGIIAGGSAGGIALLALLGWCCWKKKKTKKDEAGWWSLDDDPSKGAVKNVGQNQAGNASSGISKSEANPWQSTDSFTTGPYSANTNAEKQQQDWTRFDEKSTQRHWNPHPPIATPTNPQDHQAQRNELFARPGATQPRALASSPSASSLLPHQQPPRAPFAHPARPDTGNYSVNDVISFTGGSRQNAQYPPVSSVYPASAVDYPASATATPPPFVHPQHDPYSGLASGSQAITDASYPPQRPPRPSEVPSAPPSPYNYVKKAERPTSRDDGIAGRFMDVMTGKVGKEYQEDDAQEELDEQPKLRTKRQSVKPTKNAKSKKDTIMGLTDAYAGGGEEQWAQVELEPNPALTPPVRKSTLTRGSSKRSQRSAANSPTKPRFPRLPEDASTLAKPALTNSTNSVSHNSSRIDSKPLKELESYFGSFAPPNRSQRELSGVSQLTNRETDYSRGSTASSNVPRPGFARQQSFGTPGQVPTSDSQNSLSPLAVPQPGQPGAYGEFTHHPHSIYSTAAELSDMSTSGSSAGSPAKVRVGAGLGMSTSSSSIGTLAGQSPVTRSRLGTDVFGSPSSSHPLDPQRPDEAGVHSLSPAEQAILNQLGLASPSTAGERTPDLSLSSMRFDDSDHHSNDSVSSVNLVTPSTAQFSTGPTSLSPPSPTVELKTRSAATLAVPTSPSELAKNGFIPLAEMSKKLDQQYRSATLSMYNLYD